MTFSIVATDGETWGVAVASKFLAVGAAVPVARAGVGAIATQSYANLAYRPDGIRLLGDGRTAQETLDALTNADERRSKRQAGIVDGSGRAATYTGEECLDWAGGVTGPGVAIQGNILAGPDVVDAMKRSWDHSDAGLPLSRRLLASLQAGDDAGGDRRGRQSASLLVVSEGGGYGGGSDQLVDLRVDDNVEPIPELSRLLDLHDTFFSSVDEDQLLPLEGLLADEVRDRLMLLGQRAPGDGTAGLDEALARWASVENLEERMRPGKIDPAVLDVLRERTARP